MRTDSVTLNTCNDMLVTFHLKVILLIIKKRKNILLYYIIIYYSYMHNL